jgi:hypothetical protein
MTFFQWLYQLIAWLIGAAPEPATNLHFSSWRTSKMSQANVTMSWTPSVTPGVTSQTLTVTVNGTAKPPVTLGPAVASYAILVNEKDVVAASLTDTDGVLTSSPLSGSYTVPEVTPPAPPTNLAFTSTPVPGT